MKIFILLCVLALSLKSSSLNATEVEQLTQESIITRPYQAITYFKVDYKRPSSAFHSKTLSFREENLSNEDIRVMELGAYEEVDLASTNIKNFGLASLKPSQETLLTLDISDNFLDSRVIDDLILFNRLQTLNIGNNLFNDTDLIKVSKSLNNLQDLNMQANSFTRSCLENLKKLQHLEILNCGYMDLGNEGIELISQLNKLTHLYVRSCNFDASALQHLAKMPNLQVVDISYNIVKPTELSDFTSKTKATVIADFMQH